MQSREFPQIKRELPNFTLGRIVQFETSRGRCNREEGALGYLRLGQDLQRDAVAALSELSIDQHLVLGVLGVAIDDVARPANETDGYRHNADDRSRCRAA